jgi:hypothetical protein
MDSPARLNAHIEWLERTFADVTDALGRWAELSELELASLRADWSQAMTSDLRDLLSASEQHQLTPELRDRLLAVLAEIQALRPVLVRHEFVVPLASQLAVA